jgi:hypothetical protein
MGLLFGIALLILGLYILLAIVYSFRPGKMRRRHGRRNTWASILLAAILSFSALGSGAYLIWG